MRPNRLSADDICIMRVSVGCSKVPITYSEIRTQLYQSQPNAPDELWVRLMSISLRPFFRFHVEEAVSESQKCQTTGLRTEEEEKR